MTTNESITTTSVVNRPAAGIRTDLNTINVNQEIIGRAIECGRNVMPATMYGQVRIGPTDTSRVIIKSTEIPGTHANRNIVTKANYFILTSRTGVYPCGKRDVCRASKKPIDLNSIVNAIQGKNLSTPGTVRNNRCIVK